LALLSSDNDSLFSPSLRFKLLLLRLQYTIAATATITSTRRTTANGANNTGQRLVEETGIMLVGLVEGEGCGRLVEEEGPGRLVEAAEVTPMKVISKYSTSISTNNTGSLSKV